MKSANCKRVSVLFGGDICVQKKLKNDFINSDLEAIISKHAFRIANWEGPFKAPLSQPAIKAGPVLSQHESAFDFLNKNLFNIYSLANNHIFDFGPDSFEKTKLLINSLNFKTTGADLNFPQLYEPLIIEKNNVKIAVFATGENQFGCCKEELDEYGYAWIFSRELINKIMEYRKNVDFIVLNSHAGLEMQYLPLPEWREHYKMLIDLGVDLIAGTHPHIIQPFELYKGKYIYYSLGNFLFNKNDEPTFWYKSLLLSCDFSIANGKREIHIQHIYTKFENQVIYLDENPEILSKNIDSIGGYCEQIRNIVVEAWKQYYEEYYFYTNNKIYFRKQFYQLPKLVRLVIIKIIDRYRKIISNNQVLLYHNISIDTHRFAVQRALKELNNIGK